MRCWPSPSSSSGLRPRPGGSVGKARRSGPGGWHVSRHRQPDRVRDLRLVGVPRHDDPRCPRCESILHPRKPNSIVRVIGRWSMIDIFMESLLGALVVFGSVITIEPGVGAVAFCGVVILTMLAAETFDPRLMWDAAAEREPAAVHPSRRLAAGD